MIPAKNNIIVKIRNSDEYALFNPLSGSFDMMGQKEHDMLTKVGSEVISDYEFSDYLLERGYIFRSAEDEQKAYQKAYEEFRNEIADTQVQLMLIPTYGCNLACVYCYQHGVNTEHNVITHETVDAFFDYARANFSNRSKKPFITLFGGEPLINCPSQRIIIDYIIDKCAEEGYELAAVTNGYDFTDYVDILKKAKIKEIQFTLDGSRDVHNKRRATANGKGTFDRVIQGMEAAIQAGFPVNLRTVVDLENIEDIVHLAEYLDAKGWLDLPPERFKTQIGRNYELFSCYAKPQHLMTQTELWAEYSALSKRYPILSKFHRPNFYVVRHIVDTGELFIASFDTCPAAKTEWVFDLNGEIYGCTASCGREEYLLGTYYPEVKLNDTAISAWQKRDVQTIEKCKSCKYDVICGGGCGIVAANKNCGNALSPDCRPVQELVEIGIHHYIDDIRKLTEEPDSNPADVTPASQNDSQTETACCCGSDKTKGCAICGSTLIYADNATEEKCFICGNNFETYNKCKNGHYVCDSCHSADIRNITALYLLSLLRRIRTSPAREITAKSQKPSSAAKTSKAAAAAISAAAARRSALVLLLRLSRKRPRCLLLSERMR
jgi:uncharacterized protein